MLLRKESQMSRWNPACDDCVLNGNGCLRQEADAAESCEDPCNYNDFEDEYPMYPTWMD